MSHFFTVYKALEHKETAVNEISSSDMAVEIISKAIDNYIIQFCK